MATGNEINPEPPGGDLVEIHGGGGRGIIPLADGGFAITWSSGFFGSSNREFWSEIYVKRYNADGTPQGQQVLLDPKTVIAGSTSLAEASNGDLLAAYGNREGLWIQRLSGDQPAKPAIQVAPPLPDTMPDDDEFHHPDIVPLQDGGYLVIWSVSFANQDIFARRYDVEDRPLGPPFTVSTTNQGIQWATSSTQLSSGDIVITWESLPDFRSPGDIYMRVLDKSGLPKNTDLRVNSSTIGNQYDASVTSIDNGGFLVSWQSDSAVHGQRFDANGVRVGAELLLRSDDSFRHFVEALPGGGFVGAFLVTEPPMQEGGSPRQTIAAQYYDSLGNPSGPEFIVNQSTRGNVDSFNIAVLESGAPVVYWSGGRFELAFEIFAASNLFTSEGDNVDFNNLSADQAEVIKTGADVYNALGGDDVVFFPKEPDLGSGKIFQTSNGNRFTSGDGDDDITGSSRADFIWGGKGNDELLGNDENDRLWGVDGNDVLIGGRGNDLVDGGTGDDTLIWNVGDGTDTFIGGEEFVSRADHDVLEIHASPTDFSAINHVNDITLVHERESGSLIVRNTVEKIKFDDFGNNVVQYDNFYVEMAELSSKAYSNFFNDPHNTTADVGWRPILAQELGLPFRGTKAEYSTSYEMRNGVYLAPGALGTGDGAAAHVYGGIVDNQKTIVISFRGTD